MNRAVEHVTLSASTHMADRIEAARKAQEPGFHDDIAAFEESKIYIGLNDMDTKSQKCATDSYIAILKRICRSCGVPFSFNVVDGGYIHDDGEYTEEKTIVLSLVNVPHDIVDEIAKESCVLFHQESVLVTVGRIHARRIREAL